jgi:endonuclease/exonuclease/phosphatase family metal-dependent hydrolase
MYRTAARGMSGEPWHHVISESGVNTDRQSDHLGLLYRTDLFRQLETIEYHAVRSRQENNSKYGKPDWGMRAALFLRLMHIPSKREFYVGTLHLKCCGEGEDQRAHQAGLLAKWIKQRDVPVILLGDTNIPIEPGLKAPQVTAAAFKKLTTEAGMVWVEPANPVKTQCDVNFNSMLDQVYHTANLQPTSVSAEIQFTSPSYCDGDTQGFSDHRPIVATFTLPD